GMISTSRPAARTSSAVASRPSLSMSTSATDAPAAANAMALARPMPAAAPGIRAVRPSSSATVVALERRPPSGPATGPEHPLVLRGQAERVADLVGAHAVDVAHRHHQTLPFGQLVEGVVDESHGLVAERAPFRLFP